MQASVLIGQAKPNNMDDVVSFCQTSILQAMRQQTGCLGVLLLANHNTRQVLLISLWASLASLLTAEASAYLLVQLREMTLLLERPLVSEHYAIPIRT